MAARSIAYLREAKRQTVQDLLCTDSYSLSRRGLIHKLRNLARLIRAYEGRE